MSPFGPAGWRRRRSTMVTAFLCAFLFMPGCSLDTEAPGPPLRFTLDELAVHARDTVRSFFLSDRRGGFVVGRAGARVPFAPSWSVDGEGILRTIDIFVEDTLLGGEKVRGVLVRPDRAVMDFGEGKVTWAPVEGLQGRIWGLAVLVETDRDVRVSVRPAPEAGFVEERRNDGISWRGGGGGIFLALCGGPEAVRRGHALEFGEGRNHRVVFLLSGARVPPDRIMAVHEGLPELMARRTERMERVLERSYLRLSDSTMTKALAWARLTLDAMIVEQAETLAVSSVPWDGSYEGRSSLQSLAGMALITGEYATAVGILRSWAATQDSSKGETSGRIASRLQGPPAKYRGVDVSGWFVRGLYDYVVATDDTASVGRMFPVVRRSIEGMGRNNVRGANLVVHRGDETWMGQGRFDGSEGPYSAVEVQTLWQYQQTIGGILAQLRGDSALARRWFRGAAVTAAGFARAFIDTATNIVYDYLDGRGKGVDVLRPNALLALDGIDGERVQQALLARSVRGLMYPQGPGTLVKGGRGFLSCPAGGASPCTDGPVAPWLVGPFVYGLTRADRQDLAYPVSRVLAERSLSRGMVGTIPEALPAGGDGGEAEGEYLHRASLLGASEFLRTMYQDYLGIRVDAPSSVIRCEPKLPAELQWADFTVYMGSQAVRGSYRKVGGTGRMFLSISDVPRPVKWRFTWIFESGDAWVGAVRLKPGASATVVFTPAGMLVYQEGKEMMAEESWFVKGLARSGENRDLPAAAAARGGEEGVSRP